MPNSAQVRLPTLILASQSPRRRQLLENLGLPFRVLLPTGDEATPDKKGLAEGTKANALTKARAVAAVVTEHPAVVIGADTLVAIDEHVLGKPSGTDEARAMLRKLSGREHVVVTGLALVTSEGKERTAHATSQVCFRKLTDEEIERYVATREPYDKAGSYAIQGLASLFIERIEGSYTNVVGLPVELLLKELGEVTGIAPHRWFE